MTHLVDGMAKGIGYGGLAATAMMLAGMLIMASGPMPFEAVIFLPLLALAILIFAIILMTLAAMLVGVPVVWLLGRIDCASAEVCSVAGALVGLTLFFGPVLASGDGYDDFVLVMAMAGMAGGGMTGWVWGTEQEHTQADLPVPPAPNRMDDPRILR